MSKFTAISKVLSGLCLSSIARGFRGGIRDLAASSAAAHQAATRLASFELRSIPAVSLDEVLGARTVQIQLTAQAYEEGMLPTDQALILCAVLVAENPRVVLEIGTFMGHTARAMAINLPEATIHTVDLPTDFGDGLMPVAGLVKDDLHLIQNRTVGREFLGTEYAARIVQHFGDTAVWDFGNAAGADFFFIDGSHTYEYCLSDSEKCLNLCRGKGVFLWHDCDDGHPGVVRMIREWRALGRDVVRINGTPLAYWKSD